MGLFVICKIGNCELHSNTLDNGVFLSFKFYEVSVKKISLKNK